MNTPESKSSRQRAPGLQVEVGAKSGRRLKSIWLVAMVVAIAAIAAGATLIGWSPRSSPAPSLSSNAAVQRTPQARISWSDENHVEIILSPGENASRSLIFTSNLNFQDIVIEPVPELAPFISIQPNSFANVLAGQPQSVMVNYSIPANTTLGTYDGTVHVRLGSQTLPQTLKVMVNVWQTFTESTGFRISYPPEWSAHDSPDGVVFRNVPTPSLLSDTALQSESFFEVRFLETANPGMLDVDQWFNEYFANGFPEQPLLTSRLTVSGYPALAIEVSELGRRRHVYVTAGSGVVVITYGLFAPSFISTYEAMAQSIRF